MSAKGSLYNLATIPTKPMLQCNGVPPKDSSLSLDNDEPKWSLSSLLDSREHWWLSRYVKAIKRLPPVTSSYITLSTIMALLSWGFNDNYPLEILQFDLKSFKSGKIWRILTPFLNFGQLWLAHIFMAQSVALYMASVEVSHCAKPEKFLEFMTFGTMCISLYGLADSLFGKQENTMGSAAYHLHTYVLYYWSRLNEGTVVNCFDLFNLPAEMVPFIFVLQNYLLYKEIYATDIAAIAAAHFYFYNLSNTKAIWPFSLLRKIGFKKLYERFNNEISR
uniref:Derlin n=2 Tax=Babesia bovis TaxID=5865 RepID=A7AV04_BABBO|eukprot:XP_001609198.1 Der1-like family [Babesia bovis T2Bo]